jgi:hypothetical protein
VNDVLDRMLTFPNVLITSHQGFFTAEALHNNRPDHPGEHSGLCCRPVIGQRDLLPVLTARRAYQRQAAFLNS